jgi:16S rRNA (guanine527-N7)-methyltransferase
MDVLNKKKLEDHFSELHFQCSDEFLKSINLYFALTCKWGSKINITANLSSDSFLLENILDPLTAAIKFSQNFPDLFKGTPLTLIDVGCGGGYVGLIWKLFFNEKIQLTLLDSDRKKINFCRQAIRELSLLNSNSILSRLEEFTPNTPLSFDLVVSRATMHHSELLSATFPIIKDNGILIDFVGPAAIESLNSSPQWQILDYPFSRGLRALAIYSKASRSKVT